MTGLTDTDSTKRHNHVELKLGSPTYQELTLGYYRILVSFYVVVVQYPTTNAYQPETLGGKFLEALNQVIPVYKYGSETGDDSSFVFCLKPQPEPQQTYNFAASNETEQVSQIAIEGNYYVEIAV